MGQTGSGDADRAWLPNFGFRHPVRGRRRAGTPQEGQARAHRAPSAAVPRLRKQTCRLPKLERGKCLYLHITVNATCLLCHQRVHFSSSSFFFLISLLSLSLSLFFKTRRCPQPHFQPLSADIESPTFTMEVVSLWLSRTFPHHTIPTSFVRFKPPQSFPSNPTQPSPACCGQKFLNGSEQKESWERPARTFKCHGARQKPFRRATSLRFAGRNSRQQAAGRRGRLPCKLIPAWGGGSCLGIYWEYPGCKNSPNGKAGTQISRCCWLVTARRAADTQGQGYVHRRRQHRNDLCDVLLR